MMFLNLQIQKKLFIYLVLVFFFFYSVSDWNKLDLLMINTTKIWLGWIDKYIMQIISNLSIQPSQIFPVHHSQYSWC